VSSARISASAAARLFGKSSVFLFEKAASLSKCRARRALLSKMCAVPTGTPTNARARSWSVPLWPDGVRGLHLYRPREVPHPHLCYLLMLARSRGKNSPCPEACAPPTKFGPRSFSLRQVSRFSRSLCLLSCRQKRGFKSVNFSFALIS